MECVPGARDAVMGGAGGECQHPDNQLAKGKILPIGRSSSSC